MTSPTTPTLTAPFDLALAKLGWPLVTIDGRPATGFQLFGHNNEHFFAAIDGIERGFSASTGLWAPAAVDYGYDLLLSLDLASPAYQLAVQRAHEELGEEVWYRPHMMERWLPCRAKCLFDGWEIGAYCLARHLPYFQSQTKEVRSYSPFEDSPEYHESIAGTSLQPPSAPQSPTPESDAAKFAILSDLQSGTREVVDLDVARRLERERDAARRDAEQFQHLLFAARAVVKADLQPLTEVDEQALTELQHQTLLFRKPEPDAHVS